LAVEQRCVGAGHDVVERLVCGEHLEHPIARRVAVAIVDVQDVTYDHRMTRIIHGVCQVGA
jgi:hypothetical protein